MTQEKLAEKTGTTKSYISKIENNIKEVRLSTLQRMVEIGLGGHLQLNIKLQSLSSRLSGIEADFKNGRQENYEGNVTLLR